MSQARDESESGATRSLMFVRKERRNEYKYGFARLGNCRADS